MTGRAAAGQQRWPGELDSSVRWQPPVVVASTAAVVMTLLLVRERAPGWGVVVLLVLALLAVYLLVVWLRTRARMAVSGSTLTVRRWRDVHRVEAAEVTAVRQRLTQHGPDFVLQAGGRRVVVPASRVRRGHSAFFDWLLAHGREPELDKGTRRTLQVVRERGLIER
ncbi:hypothetical protein GC722_00735 [Auraticoccus sp. F435]|uniref:PH domain-containing protein n=1 Tax=Auraticoccus cholistanensis TaxID=2656650 RepID=A0A6A9UTP8_9ACTN|nr:hypothetical protein [Auraticoccus cholistanensis]MVA74567.1 hypothetical protein [Auraticoccus cholistanensis]